MHVSEKNLSQIENVHGYVLQSHISPLKVSSIALRAGGRGWCAFAKGDVCWLKWGSFKTLQWDLVAKGSFCGLEVYLEFLTGDRTVTLTVIC